MCHGRLGHAYYVDQCGRPTVIQKCATCGMDIGGTNHNLLKSNVDLDQKLEGNTAYSQRTQAKDKSDPGYCLREAKEENNPYDVVRGKSPVEIRALRVLLHSAICLGAVAVGGQQWRGLIPGLFNKTYVDPGKLKDKEKVASQCGDLQLIRRRMSVTFVTKHSY